MFDDTIAAIATPLGDILVGGQSAFLGAKAFAYC